MAFFIFSLVYVCGVCAGRRQRPEVSFKCYSSGRLPILFSKVHFLPGTWYLQIKRGSLAREAQDHSRLCLLSAEDDKGALAGPVFYVGSAACDPCA